MDKNALQQLSTWLQTQLRPVDSAITQGLPVQPLHPDLVNSPYMYSLPVQSQAGPVIPAADYDLRPAVYVDHGKNS